MLGVQPEIWWGPEDWSPEASSTLGGFKFPSITQTNLLQTILMWILQWQIIFYLRLQIFKSVFVLNSMWYSNSYVFIQTIMFSNRTVWIYRLPLEKPSSIKNLWYWNQCGQMMLLLPYSIDKIVCKLGWQEKDWGFQHGTPEMQKNLKRKGWMVQDRRFDGWGSEPRRKNFSTVLKV